MPTKVYFHSYPPSTVPIFLGDLLSDVLALLSGNFRGLGEPSFLGRIGNFKRFWTVGFAAAFPRSLALLLEGPCVRC